MLHCRSCFVGLLSQPRLAPGRRVPVQHALLYRLVDGAESTAKFLRRAFCTDSRQCLIYLRIAVLTEDFTEALRARFLLVSTLFFADLMFGTLRHLLRLLIASDILTRAFLQCKTILSSYPSRRRNCLRRPMGGSLWPESDPPMDHPDGSSAGERQVNAREPAPWLGGTLSFASPCLFFLRERCPRVDTLPQEAGSEKRKPASTSTFWGGYALGQEIEARIRHGFLASGRRRAQDRPGSGRAPGGSAWDRPAYPRGGVGGSGD